MNIEYKERELIIPEWILSYTSPITKEDLSLNYRSKTEMIYAAERMGYKIDDLDLNLIQHTHRG